MIRGMAGTILWVLLAGAMGAVLFTVKHDVKMLESRLAGINRDIARGREDIHVLNAEWSFLNDPARLKELAQRHLGMRPLTGAQVSTLDRLREPGPPLAAGRSPSVAAVVPLGSEGR